MFLERVDRRCIPETGRSAEFGRRCVLSSYPTSDACPETQCNCNVALILSPDLTDKFDYTFLCGDLNFRLDISRLHADWLIARRGELSFFPSSILSNPTMFNPSLTPSFRSFPSPLPPLSLCSRPQSSTDPTLPLPEYEQALAFDQLYNLMRNGQAFVGFHEAPIHFPPTFKYDVLRTLKSKRKRPKRQNSNYADAVAAQAVPEDAAVAAHAVREEAAMNAPAAAAVGECADPDCQDEKGHESSDGEEEVGHGSGNAGSGDAEDEVDGEEDAGARREGEVYSVMSKSSGTSTSKRTMDQDDHDEEDDSDEQTVPPHNKSSTALGAKRLVAKLSLGSAAHKAKLKWNVFVASNPGLHVSGLHSSNNNNSNHNRNNDPRKRPKQKSRSTGVAMDYQYSKSAPNTPLIMSRHASTYAALAASKSAAEHETLMGSVQQSASISIGGGQPPRASSTKSGAMAAIVDGDEVDIGVYDSSSKQRVPSWYVWYFVMSVL